MPEITITNIIIAITCAVSLLALYQNYAILERFKHFPYTEKRNGEWHRLLTSSLVHADLFHLFFNMFALYGFGRYLEMFISFQYMEDEKYASLGKYLFLGLYLFSVLVGNLPSYLREKNNPYYGAIGASGGTSGVVFACILIDPWQTIEIMGALKMYGIIFAVLYLFYSSWSAKKQYDNVGHDAHIAGALGGVTFMILSNPSVLQLFLEQLKHPPF